MSTSFDSSDVDKYKSVIFQAIFDILNTQSRMTNSYKQGVLVVIFE